MYSDIITYVYGAIYVKHDLYENSFIRDTCGMIREKNETLEVLPPSKDHRKATLGKVRLRLSKPVRKKSLAEAPEDYFASLPCFQTDKRTVNPKRLRKSVILFFDRKITTANIVRDKIMSLKTVQTKGDTWRIVSVTERIAT
jgi:hypothetical protein